MSKYDSAKVQILSTDRRLRKTMSKLFRMTRHRGPADRLAQRQKLAAMIEANRVGDVVNVLRWGRDCDLFESEVLTQWPAHVIAFERRLDDMYRWAEGPETATIISASEAVQYQLSVAEEGPYFRDHAAEQMGY